MPKPMHILIVDDDEDDKEMLIEAVMEIDTSVNCTEASNGYDAFQFLKKETTLPNFIFLDLNMPRMNGWQFLELLKKNEKLTSIPVIIYTTSKFLEDKEEAKRLGALSYITKPNSITELRKQLRFVFNERVNTTEFFTQ